MNFDRKNDAQAFLKVLSGDTYQVGRVLYPMPKYKPAVYYRAGMVDALPNISKCPITDAVSVELHTVSTVDAALRAVKQRIGKAGMGGVGVLNFASAKNPGGGFLSGSMAQEEALCHASTLYPQLKDSLMYSENRAAHLDGYYNDAMNVSETFFLRDGTGAYVAPTPACTVVTSAAVNVSSLRNVDMCQVEMVMRKRMEGILRMFIHCGCTTLVLGAYGCGVFGNDPYMVAGIWKDLLQEYGGHFDEVIFAIKKDARVENLRAFQSVFNLG